MFSFSYTSVVPWRRAIHQYLPVPGGVFADNSNYVDRTNEEVSLHAHLWHNGKWCCTTSIFYKGIMVTEFDAILLAPYHSTQYELNKELEPAGEGCVRIGDLFSIDAGLSINGGFVKLLYGWVHYPNAISNSLKIEIPTDTKHALATALHLEVRGIPENQNEWETDGPNPDIYVHDGENTLGAFSSCEPLMKRLTSDECGLVSPFDAEFRAASLVRFTGQDHPFYAPRLEESQLGALRGRCVLALGKYMKEITWFRFLGVAWPMKELVGDPSLKGKLTWYSPKTSIQQFMNLAPPPN